MQCDVRLDFTMDRYIFFMIISGGFLYVYYQTCIFNFLNMWYFISLLDIVEYSGAFKCVDAPAFYVRVGSVKARQFSIMLYNLRCSMACALTHKTVVNKTLYNFTFIKMITVVKMPCNGKNTDAI